MSLPATHRPRRGSAPLLVLAALAGGATLAAAPLAPADPPVRVDGVTYQFQVSTVESDESFDMTGRPLQNMVGRAQVAGGNARIEFAEVKGATAPGLGKDGFMIVRDGGKQLVIVNPEEKSYLEMEQGALGSMMGSLGGPQGMFTIELKDASLDVSKLGAGEAVLGFATERWQVNQRYTMNVKVMGFGSTTTTVSETTVWYAPELASEDVMNPWTDVARNMSAMFSNNEEWQKLITGPDAQLPKSAAVKSMSRSTNTSDKGETTYSVTTMELTEWTPGDIPDSAFEVPEGYTKVELPDVADVTAAMKESGLDTLDVEAAMRNAGFSQEDIVAAMKAGLMEGAVEGVKEGAKEEAKDAAKGAVKRGLGRFFRRKP